MDTLLSLFPFVLFFGLVVAAFVGMKALKGPAGSKAATERIVGGTLLRELGQLDERKRGAATFVNEALEVEIDGRPHLVLRTTGSSLLGWSVRYTILSPEGRERLVRVLEETES